MFNSSLNNATPEKVGTVKAYGGTIAPTGWLLCDGSAINRTLYAELFNVIGTTYGAGDGSTTFNLPNLIGLTSDNVPCCGNGMTLGLTDGPTGSIGLQSQAVYSSTHALMGNYGSYGTQAGTTTTTPQYLGNMNLGITPDPTKSGIISNLSSATQKSLAIIKY